MQNFTCAAALNFLQPPTETWIAKTHTSSRLLEFCDAFFKITEEFFRSLNPLILSLLILISVRRFRQGIANSLLKLLRLKLLHASVFTCMKSINKPRARETLNCDMSVIFPIRLLGVRSTIARSSRYVLW